ncbi:MAG: hypothetical protein GTN73_05220 [Candidatus Aminicenantes bacterium]|nr:hypothetical protein [Candidatus Aminicenantes bacterium]
MKQEAPRFEEGTLFKEFSEEADAQPYREDEVYVETVEQIETIARELKERFLSELQESQPIFTVNIEGAKTEVTGIIVERRYIIKSLGPHALVLLPDEGMVEVPWDVGDRSEISLWEKRKETTAQNYIKFAPKAAVKIARWKIEGAPSYPDELIGGAY